MVTGNVADRTLLAAYASSGLVEWRWTKYVERTKIRPELILDATRGAIRRCACAPTKLVPPTSRGNWNASPCDRNTMHRIQLKAGIRVVDIYSWCWCLHGVDCSKCKRSHKFTARVHCDEHVDCGQAEAHNAVE
jgi:hypothetical protein